MLLIKALLLLLKVSYDSHVSATIAIIIVREQSDVAMYIVASYIIM